MPPQLRCSEPLTAIKSNPRDPLTPGLDEKRTKNRFYQKVFHQRHPNYWTTHKRTRESPEKQSDRHYKKTYGIALDDVENLKISQSNKCAICFQEAKLYVDHDHETGQLRSLLCSTCNSGIGFLKENPDILRQAAAYIEIWKIKHGL